MRSKILVFITWVLALTVSTMWLGCANNPIEPSTSATNSEIQQLVPKEVPEGVENAAFERAPQANDLTIRFLLLSGKGIKNETFHITFFNEKKTLGSIFLHFDSSTGDVIDVTDSYKNATFKSPSLQKSSGTVGTSGVTYDVPLVDFFEHWNYGGSILTIWDYPIGPGYFWRLVANFQPLGFNDITSSHRSYSTYFGYYSAVLVVHVFANANYGGSNHQYTGQQALWDNNYADEGMNDKVSSARIKYQIY